MSATPSLRCGATCVVAVAGFAAKLAAFPAWTPLRQPQRVRSRSSPVLRQDCNPATTTPQALTYGEFARAVASLGLYEKTAERSGGASAVCISGLWHFAVGCWLLAVGYPSLPPSAHACVGRDAGWQACRRTGLLRHL